jgi:hypothetical protein
MVAEFVAAIRDGRPPQTDGRAGLRVLSVLEATRSSLAAQGGMVPVAPLASATTGADSLWAGATR